MIRRDYILPAEVVAVRIFCEPLGDGHQWAVDGIDRQGGYTESCWAFDRWADALAAVPAFMAEVKDYAR